MRTKAQMELLAKVYEAVEHARTWGPLYRAVYAFTGSREQARAAVLRAQQIDAELEASGLYDRANLKNKKPSC